MPTRDEPQRLCAALQSLAAQTLPADAFEAIVVDDGSDTYDEAALRQAAETLPLRLLRFGRNQGRARARNAGLRAATGSIVVFLDSDMTVAPDFLARHATRHQHGGDLAVIGDIRFAPQVRREAIIRYMESRGVHRLQPSAPVPFKCFVTGNSSVPRALLERVGLFDEEFTAYGGEDLELGYRLHCAGTRFAYAPEAVSWHHHGRSLREACDLMCTYGLHSLPLLLRKHPELAPLLRLDFLGARRGSPHTLLLRAALAPAPYHLLRALASAVGRGPLPGLLLDYLLWHSRTRGYLEAISRRA